MEYLVQFQLNLYALIILIILFITIVYRSRINSLGKQLFKTAIFFIGLAIILEPLTWIFDGRIFTGAYFLEYLTNFLLLLLAPIISGLMLAYVDYYIFRDRKRLYRRLFYIWPTIITVVLLIVNIFYPIYFSIGKTTNIYKAEDFLWVQYLMVSLYYVYMIVFTLINRKKAFSYAIVIFFVFFSLPFIGILLQSLLPEFFFSWTSIVLSLLVIYIFLESADGEKDYLTKLYSRQSYEKYIRHLIDTEKPFSILFIDLDKLKIINDKLGHFKGDTVLIEFGRTLVKVFNPNYMVSRLAGDEFTVVIENVLDIEESIEKVYKNLANYGDKAVSTLRFSYGHQHYEKNMTIDELYVKADKKMYLYKEKNRLK
jgi:diguanylate cyclase (GGDEF)-like protein